MTNEQRMVPELRFKGFTEDWEQRELKEVSDFSKGKSYSKNDLKDGGTHQIVLYGHMYTDYQTEIKKSKYRADLKSNSVKSSGNEVLIPSSGESAEDISIASSLVREAILIGGDLNIITPKDFLNNTFLALTLSNGKNKIKLSKLAQGKSVVHLYNSSIKNIHIKYPCLNEQNQIKKLILNIENLITLHQRKIEIIKEMKTELINQMLTLTVPNPPNLRFKGYSKKWEQRKLSEFLRERNEKITQNVDYPLMSFVQDKGVVPKNDRYNREFLVKSQQKKYKKTELGDFIYSSNNLETGSIGINKRGKAVISPVYSIFSSNNNIESKFIGLMSLRKDFISKILKYRQGVVYGQWRIHEQDFLNIETAVPSVKEQSNIITFIECLDEYTVFKEEKIDNLNKIKNNFLNKLFV